MMRRRICIFGDSITWGVEDCQAGGWVDRLKVHQFRQDRLANVYNLGISADNTNDLLVRFASEALARRCDTIVFAIGINDSQFLIDEKRNMVPHDQFAQNIRTLIERSRDITDKITFIGLTNVDESKTMPVLWRETTYYTNKWIQAYDKSIEIICEEEGVNYIPMFDVLDDQDLSDGLHPNSAGHEKMFERIRNAI